MFCNSPEHPDEEKDTFQSLNEDVARPKHEGVRDACNQCDYKATTLSNQSHHIQSKRNPFNRIRVTQSELPSSHHMKFN